MDPRERTGLSEVGSQVSQWHFFGRRLPKNELVFIAQVVLIYIVVITSIVNLAMGNDGGKIWTALLSSSLGYLLPSPTLKTNHRL